MLSLLLDVLIMVGFEFFYLGYKNIDFNISKTDKNSENDS